MAGSFSDYLENKVLDHVFGAQVYTPPVTLYAALYTVVPTDAGGGTEAVYTGYARVPITNSLTNFPAASAGAKSNGTAITFGTKTDAGSVTIVGMALMDAASAGNQIGWSDLTKAVAQNDQPYFPAASVAITLN